MDLSINLTINQAKEEQEESTDEHNDEIMELVRMLASRPVISPGGGLR